MKPLLHRFSLMPLVVTALPAVLLLALASPAGADDPNTPRLAQAPGVMDPAEEMTMLFGRVERRLRRIDALLMDASQGDTSSLTEVGESGMDELFSAAAEPPQGAGEGAPIARLLEVSRSDGREVLKDIDRILEIAQESGNGT